MTQAFKLQNLVVILLLLFQTTIFSQVIIKSPEMDNFGEDGFGVSASMYNDKIVVAAARAITPSGKTGAVYVYEKVGDTWNLEQEIYPLDGSDGDAFGADVELFENTILVSTPLHNEVGAVYVYQFNDDSWNLDEKIVNNTNPIGTRLGTGLSIINENSFFTGNYDFVAGNEALAFFYEKIDGSWVQSQIIAPSNESQFGFVIFGNQTNLFLSDPGYSDPNGVSGIVYVFERQNETWVEIQSLVPSGGSSAPSGFAFDMQVDNDYLAVTQYKADALLYKKNSTTGLFEFDSNIKKPAEPADFTFGSSISIEGDYILVGSNENKVILFENQGNEWVEKLTLSPDIIDDIFFGGIDVHIYQEKLIIGAVHSDSDEDYDEDNGGVYIYDLNSVLNIADYKQIDGTVYPTPATDYIFIELSSNVPILRKEIFDLTGKLILIQEGDNNTINISSWNSGIYFIKIEDANGDFAIERFIKK